MKLRVTHNSIRIRIRKSELATLQQNQVIEESIGFPTNIVFKFALEISKEDKVLDAILKNNRLVLSLPKTEAEKWITTNQVSIETFIQINDEEQLHLLIEKDFPCLDREEEDKSDTFWELVPESPESC
ncbi:MAG: hypothetical protein AAFP82_07190 [Bacteroidota bacterium]